MGEEESERKDVIYTNRKGASKTRRILQFNLK